MMIVADDLGWADVPWHDPSIPAPTLKHLANTGVVLNQSYVQQVLSSIQSLKKPSSSFLNLHCRFVLPQELLF